MLFKHRKVQTKRRSQKKISISLKQARTLRNKFTGLPTLESSQPKETEQFQTARNSLNFTKNKKLNQSSSLTGIVGELLGQLSEIKNQNSFLIERQAEMEVQLTQKIDKMQKQQEQLLDKLAASNQELSSFKKSSKSLSDKQFSLMRASIRKNQLARTKTFMRKRAYFSKEIQKEDDLDLEADISEHIEPEQSGEEEEEKVESYQESLLQTLKRPQNCDQKLESVKEADFEEEESVMQDPVLPGQVTQETCFSRGTNLPSTIINKSNTNDLRMSVGQKMLELFNQNKDSKKGVGEKKKKRKLNFKVDVDQIEKIINEPDVEEQEKQLKKSIKVEDIIEKKAIEKPNRKQWGQKGTRKQSRSNSRGGRARKAPLGIAKVKKSNIDPILQAFQAQEEKKEEEEEIKPLIIKPSDLGDSMKKPVENNFMKEEEKKEGEVKEEEKKKEEESSAKKSVKDKEDDFAEFLPLQQKKPSGEKKKIVKKKGMLKAAPADLIDQLLAQNTMDEPLKQKENTTPKENLSSKKQAKTSSVVFEEEEDDNPFQSVGQHQKKAGNIFF